MDVSVVQQSGLGASVQSNVARTAYDASARPTQTREEKDASSVQEPSREEVAKAVSSMQDFVQSARHSVNFSLEDDSGRVVVRVTDADSGATIRQMPSEEALRLAESLEEARSLLFKTQV